MDIPIYAARLEYEYDYTYIQKGGSKGMQEPSRNQRSQLYLQDPLIHPVRAIEVFPPKYHRRLPNFRSLTRSWRKRVSIKSIHTTF